MDVKTLWKFLTFIDRAMGQDCLPLLLRRAARDSKVWTWRESRLAGADSHTIGIISALAFNPDYSGTYAAGTYSTTPQAIGIFDPDIGPNAMFFLGDVRPGGISQIKFHPTRPYIMYATSRRSGFIQIWDLRNPLTITGELLRGEPVGGTNQRLRFDIDLGGQRLAAGDEVSTQCCRP